MRSPNAIRYGSEAPLPEKLQLRAGPLSLIFEHGDVRHVRFGGREVLRRVYMAVRDRNWNTVPNAISNLAIQKSEGAFAISYDVVSTAGEIDFRWSAAITGNGGGTIEWTMRGKAHSTFWRNRLGYCVLHPIRECAGQPCAIESPDGTVENGRFPKQIAPHQPFRNIRAISHEVVPGLAAEVRFSGEIFETEDQRNWTDASFKTYSTPLDLPFPVEMKAGAEVSQSVRLSLRGSAAAISRPAGESIVLSYEEDAASPMPEIGLGQASHGGPLTEDGMARLKALNLSHLRADLDLTGEYSGALAGAVRDARVLGLPLELAIAFSEEAQLADLAARAVGVRARRWLVFHPREKATPSGWVPLARRRLAGVSPGAAFAAGTNAYFAELNRNRPDPAEFDAVCFSLNPQVHAFDNDSLVENVAAQADAVDSARRIAELKPVVVTPVTLKPRFNPNATGAERELAPGELPPEVDLRQKSLFGAAWTAGSLKYLAEGGARSITYYETTGWRGVMETGGRVFPLYHVLADAGEFAGGEVLRSRSSDPLVVDGFVLRKGSRVRMVLANMTCGEARVAVDGLGAAARLKRLDEASAERATSEPESFRAAEGEALKGGGRTELSLAPYAVLRIDFERGSR